jgi:hypothetical protein
MTAAQPNNITPLAGTFTDDAATEAARREADPQPEFVGDMPDDPEEARTYRPGEDQPDEAGR